MLHAMRNCEMNGISIHLDLDETLVHSRVTQTIRQDLRFLFPDGNKSDIRDLRSRFDQRVGRRMPKEDLDLSQRFQILRETEVQVAHELLIERGWMPIHGTEPELQRRMLRIRPGLTPFLEELTSLGDLFLCTSAGSTYAKACLQTAGVLHMFSAVHSIEDVSDHSSRATVPIPLLADNLPVQDTWVLRKLRFLGVPIALDFESAAKQQLQSGKAPDVDYELAERHHIQVLPYFGEDDDTALLDMLPQLRTKLAKLAGT